MDYKINTQYQLYKNKTSIDYICKATEACCFFYLSALP